MSNFQTENTRKSCVARMCESELADVNRRYGSNSGPGADWLLYHNESHSRHVRETAKSLARELASRGLVDEQDIDLAELAGAFHDHEQGLGSGANERASAAAARRAMSQHPEFFSERDMRTVESMILGTTVTMESGTLHQAAGASDLLQSCVADADLSALAARDGVATGLRLFCENEVKAGRLQRPRSTRGFETVTADPRALNGFLKFQISLLSEHRYLLDVSQVRYTAGIERELELTKQLLAFQESGAGFPELYSQAGGLDRGGVVSGGINNNGIGLALVGSL